MVWTTLESYFVNTAIIHKKWRVSDFQLISQLIYIINHYSIQVHPSLSACIRIPWVLDPKNVPVENFGYGAFYQKNTFSPISVLKHKTNVAGSCALNFDATDLPKSIPFLMWSPLFWLWIPGHQIDLVARNWQSSATLWQVWKCVFIGTPSHHEYFLGQNMFNHTYLGPESLSEFYGHWTGNTKDLETKVSVEDYDNAVWLL